MDKYINCYQIGINVKYLKLSMIGKLKAFNLKGKNRQTHTVV